MNDEPLLKEEKETLIFNVNNASTMPEKKDSVEPTIKEEEKSGPVSVDISALMAQDENKDLKEEPVKEMNPLDITQENPVVGDVITPIGEDPQETKEIKEEKKDIEIVETKKEEPKEKDINDVLVRNNISLKTILASLVLTLIIVYLFAQVVYNFYVGFKYRNVNETDILEVNK